MSESIATNGSLSYGYNAKLVRVIDGDTVVLDVDLGFHVTMRETFRLYGVNCPEVHGDTKAAGLAAKAFTQQWFANPDVIVITYKAHAQDKYGRWLALVWPQPEGQSLTGAIIAAGHGVEYYP